MGHRIWWHELKNKESQNVQDILVSCSSLLFFFQQNTQIIVFMASAFLGCLYESLNKAHSCLLPMRLLMVIATFRKYLHLCQILFGIFSGSRSPTAAAGNSGAAENGTSVLWNGVGYYQKVYLFSIFSPGSQAEGRDFWSNSLLFFFLFFFLRFI